MSHSFKWGSCLAFYFFRMEMLDKREMYQWLQFPSLNRPLVDFLSLKKLGHWPSYLGALVGQVGILCFDFCFDSIELLC